MVSCDNKCISLRYPLREGGPGEGGLIISIFDLPSYNCGLPLHLAIAATQRIQLDTNATSLYYFVQFCDIRTLFSNEVCNYRTTGKAIKKKKKNLDFFFILMPFKNKNHLLLDNFRHMDISREILSVGILLVCYNIFPKIGLF